MQTAITHINHNSGAPAVSAQRRRVHAHLVDLEPILALAVASGEGAGALVEPDHDGPLLVSPLRPDGGDVLPSRDGGSQRGGGAPVTGHLGVCDAHDGVVVGPLPLNACGRRRRREASVPRVCARIRSMLAEELSKGAYESVV